MFRGTGLRFAPLERGGMYGGPAFYKHYVPTGRGSWLEKSTIHGKLQDQTISTIFTRRSTVRSTVQDPVFS